MATREQNIIIERELDAFVYAGNTANGTHRIYKLKIYLLQNSSEINFWCMCVCAYMFDVWLMVPFGTCIQVLTCLKCMYACVNAPRPSDVILCEQIRVTAVQQHCLYVHAWSASMIPGKNTSNVERQRKRERCPYRSLIPALFGCQE